MPSLKLTKKNNRKNCGTQIRWAFSVIIRGNVQLGRFISLSDPTSKQFPRPTSVYFLFFSSDCSNTTAPSVDNSQVVLNN